MKKELDPKSALEKLLARGCKYSPGAILSIPMNLLGLGGWRLVDYLMKVERIKKYIISE
jgi:hypothetical protein